MIPNLAFREEGTSYHYVETFIFYYAGDNLDCAVWDARSLEELANIEKKKAVVILALELAQKMSQQDKASH